MPQDDPAGVLPFPEPPRPLPRHHPDAAEVRHLAVRAFLALECAGLARADFFLDRQTGKWFVNELNTMPGFTSISMYPKLWEASGVLYQDLISELIDLAISRWKERHQTFA